MYLGQSPTKMDDKGRVTLPRRYRDEMEEQGHTTWIMTRGYTKEILLFHRDAFNEIRKQMHRHPAMNAKALAFRRRLFGSAAEVKPDVQGRLAVPQNLREFAGLDKEAVVVGVDDHLELWDLDTWKALDQGEDGDFETMAEPFFTLDVMTGSAAERGEV